MKSEENISLFTKAEDYLHNELFWHKDEELIERGKEQGLLNLIASIMESFTTKVLIEEKRKLKDALNKELTKQIEETYFNCRQ